MNAVVDMWRAMAPRSRAGFIAACILILAVVGGLGWWAYRTDYQVLFADLSAGDAAAMTAELDRAKTPYVLADGGATILVPKDLVYKTRLKVMAKDVPLQGAVGFEVFNNADFGMTDFVQKVNYQRAIQGELTRTILAIEDVQAARVHLALPEQGLFRKTDTKPKASVTLTMKRGKEIMPEQIVGIQRLVAASVPDVSAADVTVLNQHGVALTRAIGLSEMPAEQIDAKRAAEDYLMRKLNGVLDKTFGPNQVSASVDVVLNLDQSKVTTEEVLPAKVSASPNEGASGVVVRERQTSTGPANTATDAKTVRTDTGQAITSESDYQVGRRTEQFVAAPGGIRRMTVAVLVQRPLDTEQQTKLREVVAMAVGLRPERGDAVVVYPGAQFANGTPDAEIQAESKEAAQVPVSAVSGMNNVAATDRVRVVAILVAALVLLAIMLITRSALNARRARQRTSALTPAAQARLLSDVRAWIAAGPSSDTHGERG